MTAYVKTAPNIFRSLGIAIAEPRGIDHEKPRKHKGRALERRRSFAIATYERRATKGRYHGKQADCRA